MKRIIILLIISILIANVPIINANTINNTNTDADADTTGTIYIDTATDIEYQNKQDVSKIITDKEQTRPSEKFESQYTGKLGKLGKDLVYKMQNISENNKTKIAIWVKTGDEDKITRVSAKETKNWTRDQLNKYIKSHRDTLKMYMKEKKKPVLEDLKNKNIKVTYSSSYAPIIFTESTKSEIQELEKRDDIVSIDLGGKEYKQMLDSTVPTIFAPLSWARGYTGDALVAIVDYEPVTAYNPYLPSVWLRDSYSDWDGYHATAMAGVIASRNGIYRGVADNSLSPQRIMSANAHYGVDDNLTRATDWALDNGADVLVGGWGDYGHTYLGPMSKYYDYIVRYIYVNTIFSAGNCGECDYPKNIVADPGRAFNVIAVGSFEDKNTGRVWSDDTISLTSSWNQVGTMSSKPEVVAPGTTFYRTGITSTLYKQTYDNKWIGEVGYSDSTSIAAAHVAGAVSMLINVTPTLLIWPEITKAVIMASANHEIADGHERDGAGGINVYEAGNILSNGRYSGITLFYDNNNRYYGDQFYLTAGNNARFVIAWDSETKGYDAPDDSLNADLDLFIQRRAYLCGSTCSYVWIYEDRVGNSRSWYNSFESIEFNVPTSGYYRIMIDKFSWKNKNLKEYVGFALYTK